MTALNRPKDRFHQVKKVFIALIFVMTTTAQLKLETSSVKSHSVRAVKRKKKKRFFCYEYNAVYVSVCINVSVLKHLTLKTLNCLHFKLKDAKSLPLQPLCQVPLLHYIGRQDM